MNYMQDSTSNNKLKGLKSLIGLVAGAAFALLAIITMYSSVFYAEGGEFIRKQDPSGGHEWILTQGLHFKTPFVSRLDRFTQMVTIDMAAGEDEAASVDRDPLSVKFSDTYSGTMQTSWRFSLPANPDLLEKIYQATKSQKSLSQNTLLRYAQNLLTYTGNQFLGEDFMQGGQNEFLTRLYYQAEHGLYQTKRVKKAVVSEASYVSKEDQESGKTDKTADSFVWMVEILLDANQNPITSAKDNLLGELGIGVDMISIVDFTPDIDLNKFMDEKKKRIRDRSGIVEEQRNEKEKAITAQLKGDRERIEARAVQLQAKDAAVIAEEQKVEVAKQQKALAVVNKQRELEIAQSNKGIQEANFASAKFEALANKEKGLAEAEVIAAKYKALGNDVYLRELEKEQAVELYRALPQMPAVTMPYVVTIGSDGATGGKGGNLTESLGNMSSLYLLNNLGATLPKK